MVFEDIEERVEKRMKNDAPAEKVCPIRSIAAAIAYGNGPVISDYCIKGQCQWWVTYWKGKDYEQSECIIESLSGIGSQAGE